MISPNRQIALDLVTKHDVTQPGYDSLILVDAIEKVLDLKDYEARLMLIRSAGWWGEKNMTVICADSKGHVKLAPKKGYILRSDGAVYKDD